MTLAEFIEQDRYCKEQNTPEGKGCDACPAKDKGHCADALRNLAGKLILSLYTSEFQSISKDLYKRYGLTPYNQIAIFKGELEFPS